MAVLFIAVGILVGGMFFSGLSGAVLGGIVGFLFSSVVKLQQRLQALLQEIKDIKSELRQLKVEAVEKVASVPLESDTEPLVREPTTSHQAPRPAVPVTPVPTATSYSPPPQTTPSMESVKPAVPERAVAADALSTPIQARKEIDEDDVVVEDESSGIFDYIKNYFTEGNTVVRVGIVVLFFGVAFLLKYAAEHTHIPIEFRLMGVGVGAIVMLIIGWRLRLQRTGYALLLQGGAIGVLYLTVFAAFRLYNLLPPTATFLLLLGMVVFSTMLAVLQDSRALAIAAVSGGFLAPILTSTGSGSHVALFTYYAALNVGILTIAWYKAWRPLNLIGFIFTFVIGLMWGSKYYRPELFASTEPFLILFFVFYTAIAVLFAFRQPPELKGYVDGTLVFGTPIIAFGLQIALVRNIEYGVAYSAVVLSTFYLLLATILFQRRQETMRLLVESFIALGVVFATLAIPLAFNGRLTASTWALEGAAIVWVGLRQNRRLAQAFGVFLQFAAGAAFFFSFNNPADQIPVLNSFYLGALMITIGGLFSSWLLYRVREEETWLQGVRPLIFYWGLLWWLGAGVHEIYTHCDWQYRINILLVFMTVTALAAYFLDKKLDWQDPRFTALCLLPALAVIAVMANSEYGHTFAYFGYIPWLFAFSSQYWLLRRYEERATSNALSTLHALTLWVLVAILTWEIVWGIQNLMHLGGAWILSAYALLPALVMIGIRGLADSYRWPMSEHRETYLGSGAFILAGFIWLWSIYANLSSDGSALPLLYAPILNPLDVVQALVILALVLWVLELKASEHSLMKQFSASGLFVMFSIPIFIWLNAILLRSLHHWLNIPYNFSAMSHSIVVQASLSLFWALLALCLMVIAASNALRALWLVGAALMGVVVVKLFIVDLSSIGTLARAISFIGVAVLMLITGYLSPMPPRQED